MAVVPRRPLEGSVVGIGEVTGTSSDGKPIFEYGVHDDYSGANFAQSETADGKNVAGSYTVHLPDGRVQTVTYTADHYNGYVADVAYTGEAHYPEAKPYHPAPAPKYHPAPAPAYKPAPVYHA